MICIPCALTDEDVFLSADIACVSTPVHPLVSVCRVLEIGCFPNRSVDDTALWNRIEQQKVWAKSRLPRVGGCRMRGTVDSSSRPPLPLADRDWSNADLSRPRVPTKNMPGTGHFVRWSGLSV